MPAVAHFSSRGANWVQIHAAIRDLASSPLGGETLKVDHWRVIANPRGFFLRSGYQFSFHRKEIAGLIAILQGLTQGRLVIASYSPREGEVVLGSESHPTTAAEGDSPETTFALSLDQLDITPLRHGRVSSPFSDRLAVLYDPKQRMGTRLFPLAS